MKYRANPIEVDAQKITRVGPPEGGSYVLTLDDGSGFLPSPGMLSRMRPHIGDYVVTQSDGYIYLNPKDVFERKYSPIG